MERQTTTKVLATKYMQQSTSAKLFGDKSYINIKSPMRVIAISILARVHNYTLRNI